MIGQPAALRVYRVNKARRQPLERIGIVAYAFYIGPRIETRNRPPDERSFQIKYGSKVLGPTGEPEEHALFRDPLDLLVTLLVGISPEEGFFVAADPAMHRPTKIFIRLEFKDRHVEAIHDEGWMTWERDHRGTNPEPVETLVGGKRDRFLDLVLFERAAEGLSPGDRQLLAERLASASSPTARSRHPATMHVYTLSIRMNH